MHQWIKDIIEKEEPNVEGTFAVKYIKPPVDYKGKKGSWFELRIADKTGEITVKFWGTEDVEATKMLYSSISADAVVKVKGKRNVYNDIVEININSPDGILKKCSESEYDISDFVAITEKNIEEMEKDLKNFVDSFENFHLKTLMISIMNDKEIFLAFKKAPAAMHYHQNWIGGLLEHTLNMVKMCDFVAKLHPELDRDLLLTGAMLHDIGKIRELEVGTSINVSREGQLVGHISIGKDIVDKKIEKIEEFPPVLRNKVLHLILSHQGKLEYGSPKIPMIPEAFVLYYVDECDAKASYAIKLKKEASTSSPWIYNKNLGSIYLE